MSPMTHKERLLAVLDRQEVDALPCWDSLWGETSDRYVREGHMNPGEDYIQHFDLSFRTGGWPNSTIDLDYEPVVVEETDETIVRLDGNGAQLRFWKGKSGTPEHVAFTIQDASGWEPVRHKLLGMDRRRIPFESYRRMKALAKAEERAAIWAGVGPFEQMHPVCGHENMLVGMALEPDWIRDMVEVYTDLTLRHLTLLFAEEGKPDVMWFYEDMGFKQRPFMSPEMYGDLVQPGHKKLFDFAHNLGLKVIVHSCGFVEPLVPGLIEAGMDCLQAMEVKAGMDLVHLGERFGSQIAFCGGVDIREIASNDRDRIDAELERRVAPVLRAGGGYILHSDHSIPPEVDHDSLVYFFNHGRTLNRRV
ncbi:MAG: uroporphyrinogen decarboxylase family protein [Kiritimatiellia bacterium]|jgi:uroporphyrinogen decarboxylase